MSKLTKRILGFALALVLVVGLLPTFELEAKAEPAAKAAPDARINDDLVFDEGTTMAMCYHCGKKVEWTKVEDVNMPVVTAGQSVHYYVDEDVTTTKKNVDTNGDAKDTDTEGSFFWLWLRGNTGADDPDTTACLHIAEGVTLHTSSNIHLASQATLNLMGKGTFISDYKAVAGRGAIHLMSWLSDANIYGCTVTATQSGYYGLGITGASYSKSIVNIYEGATINSGINMTGGTVNMYGGTINGRNLIEGKWTAAYYGYSKPVFNMYDGTVNGIGTKEAPAIIESYGGGAFFVQNGGKLNISGGTVNGGWLKTTKADGTGTIGYGGAIYVAAPSLSNNNASGTAVIPKASELNISGTAVIRGQGYYDAAGNVLPEEQQATSSRSGAIHLYGVSGSLWPNGNGAKMTMTGGTIYGSNTISGGVIFSDRGSISITGGKLYGGYASSTGGAISVSGAAANKTTADIKNTEIVNGKCGANGGNIYVNKATVNIENSTISGGKNTSETNNGYAGGGNIYSTSAAVINVTNATIENGEASNGGNITATSNTITNLNNGAKILGGYATMSMGGGSLNCSGGTINVYEGAEISGGTSNPATSANKAFGLYYGAKMNVYGGQVGSETDAAIIYMYTHVNTEDSKITTLTVNGGTVNGTIFQDSPTGTDYSRVVINDGVFTTTKSDQFTSANTVIKHGQFVYNPSRYLAEGSTFVKVATGDYRVHTPGTAATCTSAQTCTTCTTELAAKLDHKPVYTNKGETHDVTCENCTEYAETGVAHSFDSNNTCACGAVNNYEAEIGDQKFATLQAALDAAAVNGGTVKLAGDVTIDELEVRDDVTLDLNGNKLTVNGMVLAAFNTSHIVDNSADNSGRLVVDIEELRLMPNNAQLPVQMDDGVMFVNVEMTDKWYSDYSEYGFWFSETETDAALLMALMGRTAEDAGLTLKVDLKWDGNGALSYAYTEDLIAAYLADYQNLAFCLRVSGAEKVTGLTYQAKIVFAEGTLAEVTRYIDVPMNHQ